MGNHYEQLSLQERCSIAHWHASGQSKRQIAAALDRAPSTIAREIERNTGRQIGYTPDYADEQARARRWRGSRLARQPDLRRTVFDRLAMGWSPAQIAGRLARENHGKRISHESIYRYIDAEARRTNDGAFRHYLPRGKARRGFRGRRGASPVEHIINRVSIDRRPKSADSRRQPGHWEADLMLFRLYGQAVLAIHERTSRFTIFFHQPSKAAAPVAEALHNLFHSLPNLLRRTITFDNGTEFALHHTLTQRLGLKTFFCDPYAPWQKGGIENAIGRMRRALPRKTDLATLTPSRLCELVCIYNHTPRKCLDFQTPAEVFSKLLLHFKCDSASRLAPG